ncbi:MAG TPA: transposase [Nitrobacter sp.]|nr:transposase [Nitrobacter sp.]
MAPRINVEDGIYHVMARGNRKCNLFEDDRDRVRFNAIVLKGVESHGVRVFAQSLVGNHYHQVVQTPLANLPQYMKDLNGGFSQYSNFRHGRIGHLFNEPYQPLLIDNTRYLRVAAGYVVMNAVNHGFVDAPEKWKWSTYRATVGLESPPDYLCLDWLDDAFPAPSRAASQALFREYLTAKTWVEGEEWLGKPVAGSTEFEREIREHIGATMFMSRLPRSYRAINRPPLTELFGHYTPKNQRDQQMLRAHVIHAYSISEIAQAVCMHPGSVSRIVAGLRKKARGV